ncbi:ATP-dependent nuclease [Nitrospirillum pindoramense]|uniref:Putative AbiEii toxin of type IV toxin-antitoxin system n=1 Tax=Nitrospirillum amazonense TaxID=28077 RepID=A0A560HA45_9PROT|nr:AAA family ATPase [Nitrospirillum amazonense]TWB43213.1 putative AbiEii toxin of type IV toxin-antitoxin system [Nitrospirillum amazonense]
MDVRHSDIESLEEKVKKLSYDKYLHSLRLVNVRSFTNQKINFDFPVTAIIGTNGGGKSTILGAVALAYKDVRPGDFFPKSNIGDTSMANWRIEYEIVDRKASKTGPIQRNARFVAAKWRRDTVAERNVVVIPIQRTVPANEQTKFKQFIGINQNKEIVKTPIPEAIIQCVSRILGKDAKHYERVSLKSDPSKSILVGMHQKNDYSQFHFGAGEASIIEMVSRIEDAIDNSLILVEEIENGLHPLATHKMVEYLLDVAKRKRAQIVFTTHSEYALEVLPQKAIWACIDGTAYQVKLTIESLRALTGTVSKNAVIFVEDDFAKDLVEEMLRQYARDIFDQVQVHKAGGYPFVIEVLKHHKANPTVKAPAVAVIDGDNPPLAEPNDGVIELPDGTPDSIVFGFVHDNAEEMSALVQQRCQCPSVKQDIIISTIKAVKIDTTDPHLYFSKLGEKLGFISEIIMRRGLISIYVEKNSDILRPKVNAIRMRLGIEAPSVT